MTDDEPETGIGGDHENGDGDNDPTPGAPSPVPKEDDDADADADDADADDAQPDQHEWSAFHDDEGRTYYHNSATGESSWDAPERFNPVPPPDDDDDDDGDDGKRDDDKDQDEGDAGDGGNKVETMNVGDGVAGGVHDDEAEVGGHPMADAPRGDAGEAAAKAEADDSGGDRGVAAGASDDDEDGALADPPQEEEGDDDGDDDDEPPATAGDWVEYKDEEGRVYYFNTVTELTTWDRPAEFDHGGGVAEPHGGGVAEPHDAPLSAPGSPSGDADADGTSPSPSRPLSPSASEDRPDSPEMMPGGTEGGGGGGGSEGGDQDQQMEEEEPEEPPIDPAVKRLEEAKAALAQPDSILEPGIMSHLTEVVTSDEGNPANAIQAMSESARGQTAVCGLLCRWLADLKAGKGPVTAAADVGEESKRFEKAADSVRTTAQDVVNKIATERFTHKGGDSILSLSPTEAAFLKGMMDSNRWRKLLIDLSASNRDNALLMYCLREISKRGHHREIARRIKQSDHFGVFNAMLASELSVIGKIAVSACHDHDTSISLNELTGDLRRLCTSTAYTYLYGCEVLSYLVKKAKTDSASMVEAEELLYARAIRKWERLLELLQGTMMDPSDVDVSSPLFRKRRLDVACTMSELHQRQRRRILPSTIEKSNGDPDSMDTSTDEDGDDRRRSEIETALLTFLRNFCLGTQLDDPILDKMLPNALGGDPTNVVGNLLIKYPISVEALLGYIYKPGNQRVRSGATRSKCARLIAKAVMAAEHNCLIEAKETNQNVPISEFNEVNLENMLCEGSKLCEQLENMVSFIVTAEATKRKGVVSPGESLCRLAIICAPVSQGVAMWAREITKGGEFVASASYPTISPNIMSLVRIIYLQHPFTRDYACEVAFEFLKHTNSELAYQTMNHIKEQSLRLLLFLCVRGEGPTVLDRVLKLVRDPSGSVLDASLVRYFVAGLLQVAQPPFSIPFIRSFSALLQSRVCFDAIKTSYFDEDSKQRLHSLLNYLKARATGKLDSRALSKDDVGLMQSIISQYST